MKENKMNSSEKLAKEIMKSFHSLDKRKQEEILSECGLSFAASKDKNKKDKEKTK